jgi:hypothetical protein
LSYNEARTNPLGVLHRAEIVNPDESQRRIVARLERKGFEGFDPALRPSGASAGFGVHC